MTPRLCCACQIAPATTWVIKPAKGRDPQRMPYCQRCKEARGPRIFAKQPAMIQRRA